MLLYFQNLREEINIIRKELELNINDEFAYTSTIEYENYDVSYNFFHSLRLIT